MGDSSTLLPNISYHAWNGNRSQIAICPNSSQVFIYAVSGEDPTKWVRKHVLDEHSGPVSGIDWNATTNLIVTCSHDRNAYVWRYDDKSATWKPTLVILRINRAATSVKWSPTGAKFAVGSGAKCVPVCHFEQSNDWWISRMIKKHKSTVLSIDFSPNGKFIVTGAADMKCRVFSAFMEGIDNDKDDGYGAMWPDQHEFGEMLAEFDVSHAWVHSVAWSPLGQRIAFATHGSTIHFVQLGVTPAVQTLFCRDMPYLDMLFANDDTLVAAGFQGNIDVYSASSGKWSYKDKLDKKAASSGPAVTSAINSARSKFAQAADQGQSFGSAAKAEVETKHKNIIVNICYDGKRLSTAGMDGKICFWDIPK